jgi:hypothetical protein
MDFPGFNFQWEILWTRSTVGGALGYMVGQQRCRQGVRRRFADMRGAGARGHRCSLVVAEEGEEVEVEPEVGSLEHR